MGDQEHQKKQDKKIDIPLLERERRDILRSASLIGGGVAVAVGAVTVAKLSPPPKTPIGKETIKTIPEMKRCCLCLLFFTPTGPASRSSLSRFFAIPSSAG